MPSQNLPKPNVPGQASTSTNDQGQAAAPPPPPTSKLTYIFQKTTPGVSSRENPAGRPPTKPTLTPERPLTDPTTSEQLSSSPTANSPDEGVLTTPAHKDPLPRDLELKEGKVQLPQPFVPSQMEAASKPVIVPAGQTLTTSAGVSSAELQLGKPTTPAKPTEGEGQEVAVAPPELVKTSPEGPNEKGKKGKISFIKILLALVALLLVGAIAYFVRNAFFAPDNTPVPAPGEQNSEPSRPTEIVDIVYWGLWEDGEILSQIFQEFEAKEGIRVDYRKQSHRDYRERLEQALISGSGPDVFRYHMTWTSMLSKQLAIMPTSIMTSSEYQQTFYPIAYQTLQVGGNIVGIPLMYEGLALFYNKEMLRNANLSIPTTWSELRSAANQLTVPSNVSARRDDNITQAGLAIGNASNVDHYADILALLILQNGGSPANPSSQNVEDALTFYTNFLKQDKVWSNNLPNSTVAFARGEVAMMFAPSWRALDVKEMNPQLDFAIAQVPQLSSVESVSWATFWAEGVNKNSTKQEAAWKLLKYLSSKEVLKKFYNSASLVRAFGNVYPRPDMANEFNENELLAAFVADAPFAQSFPMASRTHDNGANDQLIQYYADAINAVLAGTQPAKALQDVNSGVSQVIQKYESN